MIQLSPSKKRQLLKDLKTYSKKYLSGKYSNVDESATRIMVNDFLSKVLGYASLDEIKTEYMIRGTYADYIIQTNKKQHFIVEVKSQGMDLSDKHLRQAVNYAANEGVDWVLLTNGRTVDFYRVLFNKPIECRKVFGLDLADKKALKCSTECLQYLTRAVVTKKGLDFLWNRFSALEPKNMGRLLYSAKIVGFFKRELKRAYKARFSEDDICEAIKNVLETKVLDVKPLKERRAKKGKTVLGQEISPVVQPDACVEVIVKE